MTRDEAIEGVPNEPEMSSDRGYQMEMVVSYARKINHDLYGGSPYESSDHFCSLKSVIDVLDEKSIKEAHEELSQTAQELVQARVEMEMMDMTAGLSKREFNEFLDAYLENRAVSVETYNKMSVYQKGIIQVVKRSKNRKAYANKINGDEPRAEGVSVNG